MLTFYYLLRIFHLLLEFIINHTFLLKCHVFRHLMLQVHFNFCLMEWQVKNVLLYHWGFDEFFFCIKYLQLFFVHDLIFSSLKNIFKWHVFTYLFKWTILAIICPFFLFQTWMGCFKYNNIQYTIMKSPPQSTISCKFWHFWHIGLFISWLFMM